MIESVDRVFRVASVLNTVSKDESIVVAKSETCRRRQLSKLLQLDFCHAEQFAKLRKNKDTHYREYDNRCHCAKVGVELSNRALN